jgi:hypothetical protein
VEYQRLRLTKLKHQPFPVLRVEVRHFRSRASKEELEASEF